MRYRIGVDIGGTFTDCVVADERGGRTVSKAPSTPGSLQDGVLEAVGVNAEQLGITRPQLLAATDLFVHGTTQATNAMLTRTGARTGLITTKGHEDAIIIGKVYAKVAGLPERDLVHSSRLRKPDPIVPRSLIRGVTERIDRDGDVIVALQEDEVIEAIDSLLAAGVEAIAVSLLWSFVNDAHERRIKELLTERAPQLFTAYSHEVAPVLGEYERTATTAITAYVGPKVVGYLERLESQLRDEGLAQPLLVMQASGGLTSVLDAAQRPIVTLDSGPDRRDPRLPAPRSALRREQRDLHRRRRHVVRRRADPARRGAARGRAGRRAVQPADAEGAGALDRLGRRVDRLARRGRPAARRAAERGIATGARVLRQRRHRADRHRRRSRARLPRRRTTSSAGGCGSTASSRCARSPRSGRGSGWRPRRSRSASSGSSTRRWRT